MDYDWEDYPYDDERDMPHDQRVTFNGHTCYDEDVDELLMLDRNPLGLAE